MSKGQNTRAKFVTTASILFQSSGYHGAGLQELIDRSGAPKGSFYYHFPRGKEELALAVIDRVQADVSGLFARSSANARNPSDYITCLAEELSQWMCRSNYSEGCPLAGLTLELSASLPEVAKRCSEVYVEWGALIASDLADLGLALDDDHYIPATILSAFEGATILSRAMQNTSPIRDVEKAMKGLLNAPR